VRVAAATLALVFDGRHHACAARHHRGPIQFRGVARKRVGARGHDGALLQETTTRKQSAEVTRRKSRGRSRDVSEQVLFFSIRKIGQMVRRDDIIGIVVPFELCTVIKEDLESTVLCFNGLVRFVVFRLPVFELTRDCSDHFFICEIGILIEQRRSRIARRRRCAAFEESPYEETNPEFKKYNAYQQDLCASIVLFA
jgi:hypothetical protein